ncbi:hypothetical protein F4703DRAFT_1857050, partial [Phycomyces blakesleeanus]
MYQFTTHIMSFFLFFILIVINPKSKAIKYNTIKYMYINQIITVIISSFFSYIVINLLIIFLLVSM